MSDSHCHSPKRLFELDGLRGIAALGVALFHLKIYLQGAPNPIGLFPGGDWVLVKGWHLVDLFFVLSGYIFAHCYLHNGVMRAGVSFSSFGWARFARLWPLHFAVLCFTAFMLRIDPDTTLFNFVMSMVMLHVFLPEIEVLNPPVWSISVEFVCYALFAMLALQARKSVFLIGACALVVVGGILIWSELMPYVGRGLFGFFVGSLVYHARGKLAVIPLPVLVIAVAIAFLLDRSYTSLMIETLICWPAAILLARHMVVLRTGLFQWLGSRSYAIYIVHVPIFIMLGNHVPPTPHVPIIFSILFCLGTVLLIADILHRRLEIPAQTALRTVRLGSPVRTLQS